MSGSEEKLAPVTYLFGAKAPAQQETGQQETGQHEIGEVVQEAALPSADLPSADLTGATLPGATLPGAVLPQVVLSETEPLAGRESFAQHSGERSGKFERVNNVSLNALARKGMSSVEMTQLLESREIDPDAVAAEIDRLEGAGLLDDLALAETLVRTLQERKGLGRSAINAELRRRKIDVDAINEAMDAVDGDDELTRAIEIAQKRASQLRSYDAETAKRRLSAYLMRRGYSGIIISAAITASLGSATSHSTPRFR